MVTDTHPAHNKGSENENNNKMKVKATKSESEYLEELLHPSWSQEQPAFDNEKTKGHDCQCI